MRIMERVRFSAGVLPFIVDDEYRDLRNVIRRIALILRFRNHAVRRRCNATWRNRVLAMNYPSLRRELRFLLYHSGFRIIGRFYERFLYNVRSAILITGEFIIELRMENLCVLSNLMAVFREERELENLLEDSDTTSTDTRISGRENPVARQLFYGTSSSESDISSNDEEEEENAQGEQQEEEERQREPQQAQEQEQEERREPREEQEREFGEEEQQNQEEENRSPPDEQQMARDAIVMELMALLPPNNDNELNIMSTDDENTRNMRRLYHVLRYYQEPHNAVLRAILSEDPRPTISRATNTDEISRSRTMMNFYTRTASVSEQSFYSTSDENQLVLNYFDDTSPIDRRINEFNRRRNNTLDGLAVPGVHIPDLIDNARRMLYCPRAQELRWFHDQALDENSPLYTDEDLEDLLERVRESFNGVPED